MGDISFSGRTIVIIGFRWFYIHFGMLFDYFRIVFESLKPNEDIKSRCSIDVVSHSRIDFNIFEEKRRHQRTGRNGGMELPMLDGRWAMMLPLSKSQHLVTFL